MNLKKKMTESTEPIKEAVASIFIVLLVSALTGFITFSMHRSAAEVIRDIVVLLVGGMIILFLWYQSALNHTLEYDNERHQIRFFVIFFVCYLLSVGMIFLPIGSWCFMAIMVLLSMFSNFVVGLSAGCVLLVTTAGFSPNINIYVFFLYFMLGLIGISLFQKLDEDFRIGEPLFLSALCSLVLQTAYLVIFENQPLNIELLLIPLLNLFINLVLLFLILKYFSRLAMYHIQDKYAQINDPEFPVLAQLKLEDKEHYFEAVHRAYLGDRISKRLHMNDKAVKGCSYYYKLARDRKSEDADMASLQDRFDFPLELKELMQECMEGHFGSRESCVVLTSDRVITRIRQAQQETDHKEIPYDKIIAEIFDEMLEGECLLNCDISIKELRIMEKVFIEERLYYDFLR